MKLQIEETCNKLRQKKYPLNINNSTLRNLRASQDIPFYKLSGTFLYKRRKSWTFWQKTIAKEYEQERIFLLQAETDRFQDIKIKRLKKKYGCDGYAVYQYALNGIYRVDGSYIRWTSDQHFDCADYWGIHEERVEEIVDYCAEIGLFDSVVWKTQCIPTSRAIEQTGEGRQGKRGGKWLLAKYAPEDLDQWKVCYQIFQDLVLEFEHKILKYPLTIFNGT